MQAFFLNCEDKSTLIKYLKYGVKFIFKMKSV